MLIKRWRIEDKRNESGFRASIHIDYRVNPQDKSKYYTIHGWGSSSGVITEDFAKKLISVMEEDFERGSGEIWFDGEGKVKSGMTLNYIEGKILKAGWAGEERRRVEAETKARKIKKREIKKYQKIGERPDWWDS